MIVICHFTYVRAHRMYHTKKELWTLGINDVSVYVYQLQWMYHSAGDGENVGGYACVGVGYMWEISVASLQFWCEYKARLTK